MGIHDEPDPTRRRCQARMSSTGQPCHIMRVVHDWEEGLIEEHATARPTIITGVVTLKVDLCWYPRRQLRRQGKIVDDAPQPESHEETLPDQTQEPLEAAPSETPILPTGEVDAADGNGAGTGGAGDGARMDEPPTAP